MAELGRTRTAFVAATVAGVTVLAAGCGSGPARPAAPARPVRPHSAVAPAALAGPTGAARRALAARYLAIAKAGNHQLEAEFGRLHGPDRRHLAAAHRDLLAVAATERQFDQRLLGIAFPPKTEYFARFLYWVNQARASMTAAAAAAPSLARLRADEHRLALANVPVEQAVTIIRSQLGLPPPERS